MLRVRETAADLHVPVRIHLKSNGGGRLMSRLAARVDVADFAGAGQVPAEHAHVLVSAPIWNAASSLLS